MRSKSRFADEIREHVCNVLLNDHVIDLVYEAEVDFDDVMDRLQPLLTRRARAPFVTQTLLHAALPNPRRTLGFMSALHDTFDRLPDWEAATLRAATLRVAQQHTIEAASAEYICTCWVLFGPSPLDPFASMQALGRDTSLARCAQILDSFHANLTVG